MYLFPSSPEINHFISQKFDFGFSLFPEIAFVLLFPSLLGLCFLVPNSPERASFIFTFLFLFFISISLHSTLLPLLSQIFPDAVKRNLSELLPMTHLCDHLLTVCHYMHGRCYLSLILESLDCRFRFFDFGIVYVTFVLCVL